MSGRGWWILAIPVTVAILCGIGYYQVHRVDPDLEPVPATVMPVIDGLSVLRSRGLPGNECCEPNPGSRTVMLETGAMPIRDAIALVQSELRADGWYDRPCQPLGRTACLGTAGYVAYVGSARHELPESADVLVHFERAESES